MVIVVAVNPVRSASTAVAGGAGQDVVADASSYKTRGISRAQSSASAYKGAVSSFASSRQ